MGNVFSGSEVVEMGIQIETNGRDFYNEVVIRSKDPKAKEIFQFLSAEEEKHITAFRNILDSIQKYEPRESYPGEYFAYMNALVSNYVFTKENAGAEIGKKTKSDMEAIDLGIKFEKDSIIFYEGMKEVVLKGEHEILDGLIKQEQDHLRKLVELKEEL